MQHSTSLKMLREADLKTPSGDENDSTITILHSLENSGFAARGGPGQVITRAGTPAGSPAAIDTLLVA